jgi:hypothetical protein
MDEGQARKCGILLGPLREERAAQKCGQAQDLVTPRRSMTWCVPADAKRPQRQVATRGGCVDEARAQRLVHQ